MRLLLSFVLAFLSAQLWAAPQAYDLDAARSDVGVVFDVLGASTRATAPVARADMAIDFERLSNSRIDVRVGTAGAKTALPFVAQVMKGPDVLDVAQHPEVRFVARDIALNVPGDINGGARVSGDMTIRGVTRRVGFDAQLFRQAGSEAGDLSRITVALKGAIDRRDFGITVYPDAVGPTITFDVRARLSLR